MSKTTSKSAPAAASSNWLALRKTLPVAHAKKRKAAASIASTASASSSPAKRLKTSNVLEGRILPGSTIASTTTTTTSSASEQTPTSAARTGDLRIDRTVELPAKKNGESIVGLRSMVAGQIDYTDVQKQPGRYLAVDCEMVGIGIDGAESSLARVSMVNFHGAIMLDVFVRQKERVVDYRTEFSGIRPVDMIHAKPFEEAQKEVAEMLEGRILVGHAVHNDLKALLLSHPRPDTRDTQYYAWKHKVVKTNRVALRNLVREELGIVIQSGEHSSVTDARATMAVFRIHRKDWEKGQRPRTDIKKGKSSNSKNTAASVDGADDSDSDDEDEDEKDSDNNKKIYPGGGRKGVSSGLSVIFKRKGESGRDQNTRHSSAGKATKSNWWKEL